MAKEEELTPKEKAMLENGRAIYEVLDIWAKAGQRLQYAAGVWGFCVEGTLRQIRPPEPREWGIFKAAFLFSSLSAEVTAYVSLDPGMKMRTNSSSELRAIEFGPKGTNACQLRPLSRRKEHDKDLESALTQLREWVDRKHDVFVYLDHGFTAISSFCTIEAVDEHCFALSDKKSELVIFVYPASSEGAYIEETADLRQVVIVGECPHFKISIFERTSNNRSLSERMASKLVH